MKAERSGGNMKGIRTTGHVRTPLTESRTPAVRTNFRATNTHPNRQESRINFDAQTMKRNFFAAKAGPVVVSERPVTPTEWRNIQPSFNRSQNPEQRIREKQFKTSEMQRRFVEARNSMVRPDEKSVSVNEFNKTRVIWKAPKPYCHAEPTPLTKQDSASKLKDKRSRNKFGMTLLPKTNNVREYITPTTSEKKRTTVDKSIMRHQRKVEKRGKLTQTKEQKGGVKQMTREFVRKPITEFKRPVKTNTQVENRMQQIRKQLQTLHVPLPQKEQVKQTPQSVKSEAQLLMLQRASQKIAQEMNKQRPNQVIQHRKETTVLTKLQEKVKMRTEKMRQVREKNQLLFLHQQKRRKVEMGFERELDVNKKRRKLFLNIYRALSRNNGKRVTGADIANVLPKQQEPGWKSRLLVLLRTKKPDGSFEIIKQNIAKLGEIRHKDRFEVTLNFLTNIFPAVKKVDRRGNVSEKYVRGVVLGEGSEEKQNATGLQNLTPKAPSMVLT